ncbi:MAG: hypothetical protein Q4G33_04025 [bacterium]|nr:hypothetical protein [bacterium]
MKKIIILLLIINISSVLSAEASLTEVLHKALRTDRELFFAVSSKLQGGERLITVSDSENGFIIRVFDEDDGAKIDDELNIVTGGGNMYRLSLINDGTYDSLLLETNGVKECYTLLEDRITRKEMPESYNTVTKITENNNGVKDHFGNSMESAYRLINKMKEERLKDYSFIGRRNSMGTEKLNGIHRIIAASADIMSYNSKDYDFDKLMKYILNTNANFQILNPYERGEYDNPYEGIRLVRTEYIDYIVQRIFELEPQHPYVNELVTRGFCVNNGYYCYTPAFNVNFSTKICDITAVYDIGNNVYFTVFRDIYTENGENIPEYSYAILKETENEFKLMRIEMGGMLPEENEVMEYAQVKQFEKYAWEKDEENNLLAKLKKMWYDIIALFRKNN